MSNYSILDWVAFILVMVAALNWGLIGLFDFNVVAVVFEKVPVLAKVFYILAGVAALYFLVIAGKLAKK